MDGTCNWSNAYDGGGGGGVLVDGKGPAKRVDPRWQQESGEGYGAGGTFGYTWGDQWARQ